MSTIRVEKIESRLGAGFAVNFTATPTVNGVPVGGSTTGADITPNSVVASGAVTVGTNLAVLGNASLGNAAADVTTIASQLSVSGSVGTAGQVLISAGLGAIPVWKSIPDDQVATATPTTRSTGLALQEGDRWWDSANNILKIWDAGSSLWVANDGTNSTFGNLTTTGNTTLGDAAADALTVNATSTFAAPASFNGNVVLGDAPADTVTVNATTTFVSPALFNGNVTLGDAAADVVSVLGTATFAENLTASKNLSVLGNTTLGDALTDTVAIAGNATVAGNLTANGNTIIGDAATDTATVNAIATFTAPATFNGNVVVGDAAVDLLTVNATPTFKEISTFEKDVSVLGIVKSKLFFENEQTVAADYTLTAARNTGSFGPIAISPGFTVTIPPTSNWSIV